MSTLSIPSAVHALNDGGVIALPTETVVGLACRPDNPAALRRLSQIKGRPDGMPFTIHLSATASWTHWCRPSPTASQIAALFWPGPLTLILMKQPHIPSWQVGNRTTVGIRRPNHALCQALLRHFPTGLAITSANRHGEQPARSIQTLSVPLLNELDGILLGDEGFTGLASTILDLSGEHARLLRQGDISRTLLAERLPELAI